MGAINVADILTMQDLANGHLDIKALGEAANGDENTIVTTRTGNTYPSAERAINIMFQNGGLPAKPFPTKAKMTTEGASLADGQLAQVYNETANNGLYVKTDGAWVKANYDPLALAKADATAKANTAKADAIADAATKADAAKTQAVNASAINTKSKIKELKTESVSAASKIEIAVDDSGQIYREVDLSGGMVIAGLRGTVQDNINHTNSIYSAPTGNTDIEQVWDANDNMVRRTDERGAVYIASGKGSLQHFMREPLHDSRERYGFDEPVRVQRQNYTSATKTAISTLQQNCQHYIEPPLLLVPNNLNLPNSILSAITLKDDNPIPKMQFPYGLDGNVHPYILTMRKPLYGYRYLLLDSCHLYASESIENPVMFGSNDMINFELVPDVKQPMRSPMLGTNGNAYNSYLSDPWFSYDPTDGALIWYTRESIIRPIANTLFHATKTYDGVRWTKQETFEVPEGGLISPATLYDPATDIWHLWGIGNESVLHHYTGNSYKGDWVKQSETLMQQTHNINGWHLEVKFVGTKFALCISSRLEGSKVMLGFSTDGNTWVMSDDLVVPQSPNIYKPTFEIEFKDNDTVRFVFMWGHWNWINQSTTREMPLHVQYSDWITISSLAQ